MMDISKRTKHIIPIVFMLFLSAALNINAESVWEGSAAMGRYGEFPFTGFYGASNSFPQNSFVEVENLENGKRTRVIIVDRLADSGLLMLVSNEAAMELGIYQSDIARIKVRVLSKGKSAEAPRYDDLSYNPDPDINPAAALMEPEDLVSSEPVEAVVPEPEQEIVQAVEIKPEPELVVETKPDSVLPDGPARNEDLQEAEILVSEDIVPADIADDSPEKPFEWPDTTIEPEPEPEPEPLYLTMDNIDESSPIEEGSSPDRGIHSPDTNPIWPDDSNGIVAAGEFPEVLTAEVDGIGDAEPIDSIAGLSGSELETPEAVIELISSGLGETHPAYAADDKFKLNVIPGIVEKETDAAEYITEATDYHSPGIIEAEVSDSRLPIPEPEISEAVIAVLVGDHLQMSETSPEDVEIGSAYFDSPAIVYTDESNNAVLADGLDDAMPMISDDNLIVANILPVLPGAGDKTPIDVADGYVSPLKPEFDGEISDYPDYTGAASTVEIPEVEATDVDPAVPEYNENLEVTLVPAEVRPPEIVEEEPVLEESEPESIEVVETVVVEPEVVEAVVVEPEPLLSVPSQVVMVSKLQQQKHYLQLGAFKEKNSAIKAAGRLDENYPVTILTDNATAGVSYKLLLGPLSADESGIMLYNFRAGGYSDAFIRRIE